MIMKNNKKGAEIALSTVVVIVILLIVLIVVGAYFLGGVTSTGKEVEEVSQNLTGESGTGSIPDTVSNLVNKFKTTSNPDD